MLVNFQTDEVTGMPFHKRLLCIPCEEYMTNEDFLWKIETKTSLSYKVSERKSVSYFVCIMRKRRLENLSNIWPVTT